MQEAPMTKSRLLVAQTSDQVTVAATYERGSDPGSPLVVMLHGFSSGRNNSTNLALLPTVRRLGLASLRFDFRGCGDSAGDLASTTISTGLLDAKAALARSMDESGPGEPNAIVFVGSSFGASVALAMTAELRPAALLLKAPLFDIARAQAQKRGQATMEEWRARGFLLLEDGDPSSRLNYGYVSNALHYDFLTPNPFGEHSPKITIVHGTEDDTAPVAHSQTFALIDSARRDLMLIEGAGHRFDGPGEFDAMIDHLASALNALV